MSRSYCSRCKFPEVTCVCASYSENVLPCELVVIQHPREAQHAKNTVKLAKLVYPQIRIVNSHDDKLDNFLDTLDSSSTGLIYPSACSQPLEYAFKDKAHSTQSMKTLLFIDGTWSQAKAIWLKSSKLKEFSSFHFAHPPKQRYRVRIAKMQEQLSTIEAMNYSLNQLYSIDTCNLLDVFEARVNIFLKYRGDVSN